MTHELTTTEQDILLTTARQALENAVRGDPVPQIELDDLPPALREPGASFVTLTIAGNLRGCIGALDPYQPLALDVQEHAVAAALQDYRFPRVKPAELPHIQVEVSALTPRTRLEYQGPRDLIARLRPHIDGVILQDGLRKATFLPQVWDKLPDPEEFLSHLCMKMGGSGDLWRKKKLDVFVYQVQEFQE
ncbi:MAG: AmmeMemoRadiSam system protein A [Brevefilum sp.]|nr:AmmeMemoRadiSam system protein A [Brevefilum sp.]